MERKLVKQGRNALTVTLPAKWLQTKGLKAGDSIFITERNRDLILASQLTSTKTEATLNVKDYEKSMIFHLIIAKYIEGYDTIILLHNNPAGLLDISKSLLGMIVEEHTSTKTIFKSIIAVPEENFNAVLRRATYILLQQAKTLKALTIGQATIEDINVEERLLDNNILYCLRYLNKYENKMHAYRYFLICATIELAADEINTISKYIGKDNKLADAIVNGIEQYVKLLFTNDFKKMYAALRIFKSSIGHKTFADGLAHSLAEDLYNYIGFIVSEKFD